MEQKRKKSTDKLLVELAKTVDLSAYRPSDYVPEKNDTLQPVPEKKDKYSTLPIKEATEKKGRKKKEISEKQYVLTRVPAEAMRAVKLCSSMASYQTADEKNLTELMEQLINEGMRSLYPEAYETAKRLSRKR